MQELARSVTALTALFEDGDIPTGANFADLIESVYPSLSAYQNVVVVDAGGRGNYTTLQAALAAITDASPTNRYGILIAPGRYDVGSGIEIVRDGCDICAIVPGTVEFYHNGVAPSGMVYWGKTAATTDWVQINGVRFAHNQTGGWTGTFHSDAIVQVRFVNCEFVSSGSLGKCIVVNGSDTPVSGSRTELISCRLRQTRATATSGLCVADVGVSNNELVLRHCELIKTLATSYVVYASAVAPAWTFSHCSISGGENSIVGLTSTSFAVSHCTLSTPTLNFVNTLKMPYTPAIGEIVEAVANPDVAHYLQLTGSFVARSAWPSLAALIPQSNPADVWQLVQLSLPAGLTANVTWESFVAHGNTLVVSGRCTNTVVIATSVDDGVTWSSQAIALASVGSTYLGYVGGNFILYSSAKGVYLSADGVTWGAGVLPSVTSIVCAVGNDSNMFIVFLTGGVFFYTADGVNWSGAQNTGQAVAPTSAVWTGTRYVLTANNATYSVAHSINGISWTFVAIALNLRLAWNGTVLACVSTSVAFNTVYTSADGGATWTTNLNVGPGSINTSITPRYGFGGNGRLVFIAYTTMYDSPVRQYVSDDNGLSWICSLLPEWSAPTITPVQFGGQSIVACLGLSRNMLLTRWDSTMIALQNTPARLSGLTSYVYAG
jgi:hypothetical protein